jgi:signal transduction histidine kinase
LARSGAGPEAAADITAAARDISVTNLHERLKLRGPDDELNELGNTFNDLLARLEGSFQSQRRFVANASHELRTPLATMRASLDVATGKPGRVPYETITLANRLRDELDQVDRLLENFLTLARAQRGSTDDEATVALDELVSAAIERRGVTIFEMDLGIDQQGCPDAAVTGSETLLSRMVENVIDNAVKHNEQGGVLRARTGVRSAAAFLVVENGGPVLDEASVAELAQPFRRLCVERTGSDGGIGLGLSIVAAIAEAHGGKLELHALAQGGFQVVIELPLAVRILVGVPG